MTPATDSLTFQVLFQSVSVLVVLFFVVLLILSYKRARPSVISVLSQSRTKYFLGGVSFILLALLICSFPGFISLDDSVALRDINDFQITIWSSLIYGHLLSGLKIFGCEFGAVTIFVILFYWLTVVRIATWLLEFHGRKFYILAAVFSLFLVWPTQMAFLLSQNRDTLYAVMAANLFIILYDFNSYQKNTFLKIELAGYIVALSLMRQEGLLLGALVILYLFRYTDISKPAKVKITAVVFLCIGLNSVWARQQVFWDKLSKQYLIYHFIPTLSAIVNSSGVDLETEDMKKLKKFFIFECVKSLKTDNWYEQGRGRCLNLEAVNEINISIYGPIARVYLDNLKIVLPHYSEKLLRTFNQSVLIQDISIQYPGPEVVKPGYLSSTKSALFNYIRTYHSFPNTETGLTLALVAVCTAIFALFVLPLQESVLLLIFDIRIPVILLVSPDPSTRYLFTLFALLPLTLMLVFKKYFSKNAVTHKT